MINFDIRSLLEREDRRERALAAGSKHTGPDGPRWQGPRPDAVSELDVPELLYLSQWAERPARCWNCGAGRGGHIVTPPYGLEKVGHSVCLLCGRVTVRWRADGTRPLPLTRAQRFPKRGRPPSASPPGKGDCERCGAPTLSTRRPRCGTCVAVDAVNGATNANRLFALLRDGRLRQREDACRALAMTPASLQKAINTLRRRGEPIVCDGHGGVVLEARP